MTSQTETIVPDASDSALSKAKSSYSPISFNPVPPSSPDNISEQAALDVRIISSEVNGSTAKIDNTIHSTRLLTDGAAKMRNA